MNLYPSTSEFQLQNCTLDCRDLFPLVPERVTDVFRLSQRQDRHVEGKAKEKLSLCLINLALCHEDIWGSGGIAPPFFILELSECELSVSRPGRFNSVEIPHVLPIR
jgi:hypothetical protein